VVAARAGDGGLSAIEPNHVGAIDPATSEIVAAIQVGIRPGPIAAGPSAVWVGNLRDRTLTRIDPAGRSVAATVSLGDRTPTGIAAGQDAVWVAHGLSGELSRVNARFARVAETIEVTGRPYAAPTGAVALGEGSVWAVYGDSTLARIRPSPPRVTGSALAGASPSAVTTADGLVWVANAGEATVQRFSPATFEQGPAGKAISVGKQPAAIAAGYDVLWVANRGDDTVTRIDPATGSVATIAVGDEPASVVAGADAVWVANAGDGTVSRIDPETRRVTRTIDVANAPVGIAVAGGLVWVTVQDS
jgi:serine/threonine-protein kinase